VVALQALEIPYRVVNIVSGELNNAAAKKWVPGCDVRCCAVFWELAGAWL
jgi:hypothetical protein